MMEYAQMKTAKEENEKPAGLFPRFFSKQKH